MNRNTCIYFFSSFRKIVLSHPILGISWYQIERKYHYFLKANTIFYFLTSTLVVTLVVYNQPQCLYLTRWLTQPIVYSHAAPIWSELLCSFCFLVSPLNSFSKDMAGFRHDLVCTNITAKQIWIAVCAAEAKIPKLSRFPNVTQENSPDTFYILDKPPLVFKN